MISGSAPCCERARALSCTIQSFFCRPTTSLSNVSAHGPHGVRGGNFGGGDRVSASATMDTLYDLLGALPRDDAEELRAAFRRAVKGVHPDLNPHDPDAGVKFRQIVR